MKQQNKSLNWATLGTGVIAKELAVALASTGRTLYSVANRTYEKGLSFAKEHHVQKVYRDMNDVFFDDNVDVIYISTPHNTHYPFLIKALQQGKHVLCEKSITLNAEELKTVIELAEKQNVILAEAMTIYHMPIYREVQTVIQQGVLGPLKMIQMNFGSYKDYDMTNRFFNKNLAGGALLDIGVYAISFVRWFMNETPTELLSQVMFAPSGVDEEATILLKNAKNEMATITLSLHAKQPKRGTVIFEKGYVEFMEYPRGTRAEIHYTESGEVQTIESGHLKDALLYEVLDMENAIQSGQNTMFLDYTVDVMEIMTKLRNEWGLVYPEEE